MKYKRSDKVRLVKDNGSMGLPKEYWTKELTVDENSDAPWLTYEGKTVGCKMEDSLIPSDAVIHTKTQGEYDRLMEELEKVGYGMYNLVRPNGEDCALRVWLNDDEYGWYYPYLETRERPIIPFTDIFTDYVVEETSSLTGEDVRRAIKTLKENQIDENDPTEMPEGYQEMRNCYLKWQEEYARQINDEIEKKYDTYKPKQSLMNKLTSALKRTLNKNQQELYKAEYITEGLELSSKGRNSYINNLFLEEGDHKKAVQNMVDECKEFNSEE